MVDPELIEVLSSFKDEIYSKIDSLRDEMISNNNSLRNEMNSNIDSLRDEMISNNNSIKAELESIKERLTSVENTCTVIEKEHGYKLDLLLEYASANIEKHEEYDKKFNKIDNRLFIHDAKLAIIEGSDIYKKAIKGKGKSNLKNAIL